MNERAASSGAESAFWGDATDTEALEHFRTLVNAVDDGIYQLDAEGRFVAVNDVIVELTGYDRDELLGAHVSLVVSETEVERIRRGLTRLLATEDHRSETFELPIHTADGESVPCEVRVSLLLEDGEFRGTVGIVQDISERKRRRERRERELEQYRALTEAASDVIVTIDETSTIQTINPAVEAVFGYDPDELVGESLTVLMPDELAEHHREALAQYLETGERTLDWDYVELPGRRADGAEIPLAISFSEIEYEGERYFTGIVRDISDREARERELQRKERRYEAVFEDPNILVGLLEPDGTVLDINRTAMEYIDADLEDVIGDPFWETPWWGEGDGIKDDVKEWTERAATGEYVDFEADLTRPNGERYAISGYFRPVTNDDGDVVSIIVSDRDVTERKRRERELEEAEQRYRTLIENFPNGAVALVDEDLEYVTFGGTPEGNADVTREDLEGEPLREALPERLAEIVIPHYEAALEGESSAFEETVDDRTYQFHFLPVRDEDGRVFAAMGLSQDITERREYERKLEESNERLEQFAYAASHDLQEPLRMVSSYLQLIESRYGDELDADGEEFIGFAVDGAERMRAMIDGLLAYSRVETEGDPLEPVDLERVVDDVLDDLQLQIEESDATITRDSLPVVAGDANQLRQVFQNLFENAIEYSGEEPPQIRVDARRTATGSVTPRTDEATRDGSPWLVSVSDEGIGIEPEDQERIFEVFQRLHSRGEHTGTGIGLALCERIIERHGGEIWVDSEPGEGSTFSFTLPAADEDLDRDPDRDRTDQ